MNIEEIRKCAPVNANSYYIDGVNVFYFDNDIEYQDVFLFFPSLNDFFIIDNFSTNKLKPLY